METEGCDNRSAMLDHCSGSGNSCFDDAWFGGLEVGALEVGETDFESTFCGPADAFAWGETLLLKSGLSGALSELG